MHETVLKATTQKSYYGKAHYYEYCGVSFLRSYDTTVCRIIDGKFERLWSGFSKTTLNHINDFRKLYDLPPLRKAEWLALPCDNSDGKQYRIVAYGPFGNNTRFGTIFSSYAEAEEFSEKLRSRNPYYIGFYDIEEV